MEAVATRPWFVWGILTSQTGMPEQPFPLAQDGRAMIRRLAAILVADMVGFSRLMSANEDDTIERHQHFRNTVIDPGIEANGGRIVNTSGDGLLAEFASAADAMIFAVEFQDQVAGAELNTGAERRIRYRVGINVGDVVAQGEDILGDGVNVAARLETLAEPGGICVSDAAYQSLKGRLDVEFRDIGPQQLKNIHEPVLVWTWLNGNGSASESEAKPVGAAGAMDDKPTLAVLPFDNMSGDEEQEYFADGMTEDLITEFSRMPWFYVTARNTSFTYKRRAVDIKDAGRELNAAYIVEGSVRKAGNRLRITAQLIDTETGNHVWADRYDREITDIFDIQDEITRAILSAVAPEFVSAEFKKSRLKDTSQLDAWACVMQGRSHLLKFGKKDAIIARKLFEQAISRSPGGLVGLADLALVGFLDLFYRWSDDLEDSARKMSDYASRAVAADSGDPLALTVLSWTHLFNKNWDEAIHTIDTAIKLSPNFAPAIGVRGAILACADEPDLAIPAVMDALKRSPRDAFQPFWYMGLYWAFHTIQDYEKALDYCKQAVRIAPDNPTFRRQLAIVYYKLGREDNWQQAIADYLLLEPQATVQDVMNIPVRNLQALERHAQALREMGVPESSPRES